MHYKYCMAKANLQKLEELSNIANVFLGHQLRRGEYGTKCLRRDCSQQLWATVTTNMPAQMKKLENQASLNLVMQAASSVAWIPCYLH